MLDDENGSKKISERNRTALCRAVASKPFKSGLKTQQQQTKLLNFFYSFQSLFHIEELQSNDLAIEQTKHLERANMFVEKLTTHFC